MTTEQPGTGTGPRDVAAEAQARAVASCRRDANELRDRAGHRRFAFLADRDRRAAARTDAYADRIAAMTTADYLEHLHDGY